MDDAFLPRMNWKHLASRALRAAARPDLALLVELASAALLLAWAAHWGVE
jgi:hypothetical protein